MNITRKTFYGIGILSAALNILGGAMLLFSIRADLVFNIATVAAGVMMLMLATNLKEDPRGRNFCLAAALLTVLGMVPGIVGIVCAAASWPVFAWPYFKASVPENGLHKAAFLVMVPAQNRIPESVFGRRTKDFRVSAESLLTFAVPPSYTKITL